MPLQESEGAGANSGSPRAGLRPWSDFQALNESHKPSRGFSPGRTEQAHFPAQQNPANLQRGSWWMNYFKTNDVEVGFNFRSRTPDGCLSGLRYLPGLDAARAHTNPLRRAIHKSLHRLQIHVPPAPRHIVRVRNVISELRPFAANVAYLCHRPTPRFVGISRRLCRSRRFLRRPVLRAREPPARTRARPCRLAEFSVYREPALPAKATTSPATSPSTPPQVANVSKCPSVCRSFPGSAAQ